MRHGLTMLLVLKEGVANLLTKYQNIQAGQKVSHPKKLLGQKETVWLGKYNIQPKIRKDNIAEKLSRAILKGSSSMCWLSLLATQNYFPVNHQFASGTHFIYNLAVVGGVTCMFDNVSNNSFYLSCYKFLQSNPRPITETFRFCSLLL